MSDNMKLVIEFNPENEDQYRYVSSFETEQTIPILLDAIVYLLGDFNDNRVIMRHLKTMKAIAENQLRQLN